MTDTIETPGSAAAADPELERIADSLDTDVEETTVVDQHVEPEAPETGYTHMSPEREPERDPDPDDAHMGFRERVSALPVWIKVATVVVILFLIGLLTWGAYIIFVAPVPGDSPTGSSGQPDGTAANALLEPDGPVDPAVPEGVTSWTTWAQISLTNSDMEGSMIEAHDVRYHKYLKEVLAGEKAGKSYKKLFPKGTRFINCDYNVTNDGKYKFFKDTLKQDTWFLTFPDGTPAVKMTCGNTIIMLPPGKPGAKKSEKPSPPKPPPPADTAERCPPATPGFTSRTPTGGSKVHQPVQENQAVAEAADPAPAIVSGVPDAIARDQTANTGTTQPTTGGAVSPVLPPELPVTDDGAGDSTSGTVDGLW